MHYQMTVVPGQVYELRHMITKAVPAQFNTIYPEPEIPDSFSVTLPAGAKLKVLGLAPPPYNKDLTDNADPALIYERPETYRTIMVEYNGRTFAMREHKILSAAYKLVK